MPWCWTIVSINFYIINNLGDSISMTSLSQKRCLFEGIQSCLKKGKILPHLKKIPPVSWPDNLKGFGIFGICITEKVSYSLFQESVLIPLNLFFHFFSLSTAYLRFNLRLLVETFAYTSYSLDGLQLNPCILSSSNIWSFFLLSQYLYFCVLFENLNFLYL